jgi:hypothetical protein
MCMQYFTKAFVQGGGDVADYLRRRRKVDGRAIKAVTEAVRHTPLASEAELCGWVSAQLEWTDLTSANFMSF